MQLDTSRTRLVPTPITTENKSVVPANLAASDMMRRIPVVAPWMTTIAGVNRGRDVPRGTIRGARGIWRRFISQKLAEFSTRASFSSTLL